MLVISLIVFVNDSSMKNFSFSKLGLIIILSFGWIEKIFAWEGVNESIYQMTQSNLLTSWMSGFGQNFPGLFIGVFELITVILLIFKERFGAILSIIIFCITLSFLTNGFSFSLVKDVAMLGISIDILIKTFK